MNPYGLRDEAKHLLKLTGCQVREDRIRERQAAAREAMDQEALALWSRLLFRLLWRSGQTSRFVPVRRTT